MGSIVFEHPYAFLIIFLFLFCAYFCKARFEAIVFPHMALLQKSAQKQSMVLLFFKWLSIVSLIVALMSPVIENKIEIQRNKGYAIGLLLDISRSMNAPGYVNKFAIVKKIVRKFIKKRVHDQMGIVVFADFAYIASPLTYDKSMLLKILNNLKVGMAGNSYTSIYDALFFGGKLFKSSKAKSKIIILLTDGENNAQTVPFSVSMRLLKKYGIKVYTIGIGANGDFNKNELVKIAKDTGGKFFAANSKEELQKIYSNIDKLEKSELKSDKYIQKSYLYPYPLFLAVISLLLYLYLINKRGTA